MTFFDWLSTPAGIEVQHAVIALIVAITGFISFKTHKQASDVGRKLQAHIVDARKAKESGADSV